MVAPKLNSLLEYNPRTVEGRLLVCADINISLPWLLADNRMITPIIAKADKMSLNGISDAIVTLGQKIERTNIDEIQDQCSPGKARHFPGLRTKSANRHPQIHSNLRGL